MNKENASVVIYHWRFFWY